jgi:stage II sporulation protein AA (anti-sigma F factor antagonist)
MEAMEGGLRIDVQAVAGSGDAVRVTLNGPLDARSIAGFQTEIAVLQSRGMKRFVLDMTEVKYVNSTGLSFLINLAESGGEGSRAVTLVGVQPKVKVIFDTMSVSDFFKTAPSVEAAAKDLMKKPGTVVRREGSSTKIGRVSPPTHHPPPRSKNPIVRFFRKLFGR